MVLTRSQDLPLGSACPPFLLPTVDGETCGLSDLSHHNALLVAFICNHCPYVRAIEDRLIKLRADFSPVELGMVAICSNDAQNYPDDSPDELNKRWLLKSYGFPYAVDEAQAVAKAFGAVCTPDLFLFNQERKLYYHGRLDDNWQDAFKVSSHDLKDAIAALLRGDEPPSVQQPSIGCSIKWRTS